ncbi:hypothetical protein [Paenibacillus sp. MER TA 81-3]|nr:hypothetical protein [Paenibacillus sp. MER TA 81-3]
MIDLNARLPRIIVLAAFFACGGRLSLALFLLLWSLCLRQPRWKIYN